MIRESTTLAQLLELEKKYSLNEHEKDLMFGKRIAIISRLIEWGKENEAMGLENSISDSRTPEVREKFIEDWMNDEWMNQEGFRKKRNHNEMHDDNNCGTDEEVRDDISYFTTKDLNQVRVPKFATTGLDFRFILTIRLPIWNYGNMMPVFIIYFKVCSRQ